MISKKDESNYIAERFAGHVTKFDAVGLYKMLESDSKITPDEAENKFKPYVFLLQECFEKDPMEISKFLVRKEASSLGEIYDRCRALILDTGMNSNDPKIVGELLEDWKSLKEHVEAAHRIVFKELPIPSCIIDTSDVGKGRLTYIEKLERHLATISKK